MANFFDATRLRLAFANRRIETGRIIDTSMTTDAQGMKDAIDRNGATGRGTTGLTILLLAGFVLALLGAIGELGRPASLRPVHLAVMLLFLTCFSLWSTYRSRRHVPLLLLNLGLLAVCVAFVAFFVFLAISPPFISQD